MKKKFIFEITVEMDEEEARLRGDAWLSAFLETGREFADELKLWIDNHPFPVACKLMGDADLTGKKIPSL